MKKKKKKQKKLTTIYPTMINVKILLYLENTFPTSGTLTAFDSLTAHVDGAATTASLETNISIHGRFSPK